MICLIWLVWTYNLFKGEDKVEKNNANDKEEPTENSIV
jgi:hypothetical protein